MAVTIEWRREPDRQHTGSVELRGVQGTPFLYVHPHDVSDAPLGSCAGGWWYSHRDTTESPTVAARSGIYVDGRMSYWEYHSTRALYQRLGRWRRIALGLLGSYRFQDSPGSNLGEPVATYLQISGMCQYNAYAVFDPPPTHDVEYDVRADLWALAQGETSPGAKLLGGIQSSAKAMDHAGVLQADIAADVKPGSPEREEQSTHSVLYDLAVAAGTKEIRIGETSTGPAYKLYSGWSSFTGWGKIAYTLYDADDNVVLEPEEEE